MGSDVADDKEDVKRIEKAEKAAEQLVNRKKRKVAAQRVRRPLPPPAQLSPGTIPGPSVPPARPQLNPIRPIGPCYNCCQMGHLKANCPRPNRQTYHFCLHDSSTVREDYDGVGSSIINQRDIQAQIDINEASTTHKAYESAFCPQNKGCESTYMYGVNGKVLEHYKTRNSGIRNNGISRF